MSKRFATVEEVIAGLGGYQAVRERFPEKGTSTVLMWKHRNKFPANTYAVLKASLDAIDATAPASLWGMPEIEEVSS